MTVPSAPDVADPAGRPVGQRLRRPPTSISTCRRPTGSCASKGVPDRQAGPLRRRALRPPAAGGDRAPKRAGGGQLRRTAADPLGRPSTIGSRRSPEAPSPDGRRIYRLIRSRARPCRIQPAAALSTTSARRARVMSASSISTRFTAAVESRSSQKAMGRSRRRSRLRAKARLDWQRGPFGAVHVQRQADDDPGRAALVHQLEQRARVLGELLLADQARGGWRSHARGVRDRHADGLLAEVQARPGRVRRQGGGVQQVERRACRGLGARWPLSNAAAPG